MADVRNDMKSNQLLNEAQEDVLNLYLLRLDNYIEKMKDAEKTQVEIETLHLRKILTE